MAVFSLVDFGLTADNETESELVPSIWLFEEEGQQFCWWPPKAVSMAAAVKKRSPPVPSSWSQCLVTRIVMEFDNYEEGRAALSKVDAANDTDDLSKNKENRRKKRPFHNDDFLYGSEESFNKIPTPPILDEDYPQESGDGLPPKKQPLGGLQEKRRSKDTSLLKRVKRSLAGGSCHRSEDTSPLKRDERSLAGGSRRRSEDTSPLKRDERSLAGGSRRRSEDTSLKRDERSLAGGSRRRSEDTSPLKRGERSLAGGSRRRSEDTSPLKRDERSLAGGSRRRSEDTTPREKPSSRAKFVSMEEWQHAVDRKLYTMGSAIQELTDVALSIHRKVMAGETAAAANDVHAELFSTEFQLDSVAAVDRMEKKLRDSNLRKALIHHLSSIGGVSVENAVGRLMKFIFTDETLSSFTWEGATGKRKLSDLLIISSMFAAVKSMPTLTGVTSSAMEAKAKSWVLHSMDRIKQRAKAKKHKASAVTISHEDDSP